MVVNRWGDSVRARFPELVLGACVLGFAFLLAELVSYQHYREGTQIVGFSAAVLGLVLSLLAFARHRAVRTGVLALLALLTLSGLYGAWEHREARAEDAARFAQRQQTQSATTPPAGGETGGPPPGFRPGSQIPVLAPLSLSGLAGLAFLALLARRPDEGVSRPGWTAPDLGRPGGA